MDSFINYFAEGCLRQIVCFDHALNIVGGYRFSKHEYKIVFEPNTIVDDVVDLDIPNHVFEFTPFTEISNFIANFDFCFDVIGHVIGVSETIIDGDKKRISVELEDKRLEDIEDEDASVQRISILSKISGYNTYEDFVKDASMLTLSEIKELEECYLGCRDCNKKVTEIGKDTDTRLVGLPKSNQRGKGKKVTSEINGEGIKKLLCSKHGPVSAVTQKFKIQAIVVDGSGSGIVTLWDGKVYNLINKNASELLEEEIDAKTSIEFGLSMTQTNDSTAKTAISCTGDVNIQNADVGTPFEDTADSPPPKKSKSTQDPESVKSPQNKCVRKI
ncbi:OLC1v1013223C1 [Oldenlandia corymbosa var. corymbosa]|uniref:OLC1v1013223C1 n=1 Tax=Oldenlandia corymbosa var. corymbosa TaxID=529605 RepID=A0AAV1DXZ9_OLDCO|nr:OLC1v1013223C1 [Oldenlandia corymbosa var. corymbosa]